MDIVMFIWQIGNGDTRRHLMLSYDAKSSKRSVRYTLNKKWQMSPSCITYDFPSTRSFPAARMAASVL